MKKLMFGMLMLLGYTTFATAQTDAKAKAILTEVSKKYRSYDVIKTEFTFTLDNPQANIKQSQAGTLYAKSKANKYKVILSDQELISDGKSQWTFLKSDKEVQISEVDNSPNALNPAQIFTIYEKGFKYIYTGESKVGNRVVQGIDLTPLDGKGSFFKVRLNIDKLTKRIQSATIFEKSGTKYTYTIKSFVPNVKVAETLFVFDTKKYPGVEVVDLR